MKIIAGYLKGRIIPTIKSSDYRPTSAKLKESIFSILSSGNIIESDVLETAKVLDLYCGTGSFGIECLSRGSQNITFIDINSKNLQLIKSFLEEFKSDQNLNYLKHDGANLPKAKEQYDLIFIDPPYYKNLASKSLKCLHENKWLNAEAILIVEIAKTDELEYNGPYELIDKRLYGDTKLIILKYEQ